MTRRQGKPPPGDGVMNTGSIENSATIVCEKAIVQPIITYCNGRRAFCQAPRGKLSGFFGSWDVNVVVSGWTMS